MNEVAVPAKAPNPPRRKGRQNGKAAGKKSHASENDVATVATPTSQRAGPRTPEKSGNHDGSNSRARTQARSNQQLASPEAGLSDIGTTPRKNAAVNIGAPRAFAGATFHASPAPSALPIPSFFTKSGTDSPVRSQSGQAVQQPTPPAIDADVPTFNRPESQSGAKGSPLDFMFRAHREEKEKQRRNSSAGQHHYPTTGGCSPDVHSQTAPRLHDSSQPPHPHNSGGPHSVGRIDRSELDGQYPGSIGPAFSTPYQDRIRAARVNTPSGNGVINSSPSVPNMDPEDPTEALKRYLFGGDRFGGQKPPLPAQALATQPPRTAPPNVQTAARPGSHSGNLQAMENDLRRILKLAPTTNVGPRDV